MADRMNHLEVLEPRAARVAHVVLRGLGGSDPAWLPDTSCIALPKAQNCYSTLINLAS